MTTVAYREGSWTEPSSNRSFAYRLWRPQAARALLVLLHGFGEHSGRYQVFATQLAEQGIFVAAPDLWGHGRSGGKRGDLGDITRCIDHLRTLTTEIFLPAAQHTSYALMGHSFGGLMAMAWSLKHSDHLLALIAQSPLLEVGFPIPWWKHVAARALAMCWPSFALSTNLDIDALSHDATVTQAYRTDPLVHAMMSAGTYCHLTDTRDRVRNSAPACRVPTLMLCGEEDHIVSLTAAHSWYEQLTCEKRLVTFPDSYHELHHEPAVREAALLLIRNWILNHAESP